MYRIHRVKLGTRRGGYQERGTVYDQGRSSSAEDRDVIQTDTVHGAWRMAHGGLGKGTVHTPYSRTQ